MDPTDSEARDADCVAGAPTDPDRAASPSGLDVLTMAEFVSVQDRDPGMLEDSPPSVGAIVSCTSPQPRKSSRRRTGVVIRYGTRSLAKRRAKRSPANGVSAIYTRPEAWFNHAAASFG